MSRAYREMIEKQYHALLQYADGDERCDRMSEEHEQWLADEAGQLEYLAWLDQINAQGERP